MTAHPNLSPIIFIGLATWDSIAVVQRFPEPDGRTPADLIIEAGGGPAATAAVACARLGMPAAFIGVVGDDARGALILASLRNENVDISAVIVAPGAASAAALIIADRIRATRAICPSAGPRLCFGPDSIQAKLMRAAKLVHVDQAGYRPVAALRDPRLPPLSIDAGNPIEGLSLNGVALFAPSLARLRAMFGEAEPLALLRQAKLADWAVATDGGGGAYGLGEGGAWHIAAFPVAAVSTLGAGDVFHGALVAAKLRGFALKDAIAYASIAAALSCRGVDGRSAIPDHETVMAALPAFAAAATDLHTHQEPNSHVRCKNPA